MKLRFLCVTLFLFALPGSVNAQPKAAPLPQRINKLVEEQVKATHVPGYALTVVLKGQTLLQKGYGLADIENGVPVTPRTVFGLASVTKTFTGLALLLLVEEGKVKLDDTLGKYLPQLVPKWRNLTIAQLANMTAGIPKGTTPEIVWPEEMKLLEQEPLLFPPGTDASYSNPSYRTIGTLIEKVTGQTYMEFLQKRVLKPFGMTHTRPTDYPFNPPMAVPYDLKADGQQVRLKQYKNPAINFAAGMLASNSLDMERYARGLLAQRLLRPGGYQSLWFQRAILPSGKSVNWAFGWGNNFNENHQRIGMNGGLPGVASSILIFPEDELIVIGLANARGPGIHNIAQLVAAEVLGIKPGHPEADQ
jgi:CubicO group peptidase (beta-lactamase class C family)